MRSQLSPTITRMLLSHCKWDKHLLTEKFYNNPDGLFEEAGVVNPFRVATCTNIDSQGIYCEICYVELSLTVCIAIRRKSVAFLALTFHYVSQTSARNSCGHRFCRACWSEYLKTKIMGEGLGNSILCAAQGCKIVIDDETVMRFAGDNMALKFRYQHLITNSFVLVGTFSEHSRLNSSLPNISFTFPF